MKLTQMITAQSGVFTRAQAQTAGYSRWQIAERPKDGEWTVVLRRVYVVAGTVLCTRGQLWAAYLAAGEGATVSHLSAAQVHGLVPDPHVPWITLTPNRHVSLAGVRISRVPLPTRDLDFLAGMLVTGRERTIIDCLCVLPFGDALSFQDRAIQKGWISYQTLVFRAQQRFGQNGAPQLRRLLRHAGSGARFEAERRLHALLRRRGISGWKANAEIPDVSGPAIVATSCFRR